MRNYRSARIEKFAAAALTGIAFLLHGCSSSGVLNVGPDTYMVSAHAGTLVGGLPAAKRMALEDAGKFCTKQQKQLLVTNIKDDCQWSGICLTDVTFRWLAADDPDLKKPKE